MLEKALKGSSGYKLWMAVLLALIGLGVLAYMRQLNFGLGVTGMSRDISWGFYIAQFTFLVGVAASAVMLVLPYYLHNYKAFGKIVILGEFLAIAAVIMCILFIFADLGKPMRVLNVLLYPSPNSILFWDMLVLNGYLFINVVCGWVALECEKNDTPPPKWIKPLIYLSIPWAISIHTVTAFLYAGLPGRHFWLTAIMAPRFLASAFAAGPALLLLIALLLKRITKFDAGREAIQTLAKIVTYAAIINVFFYGLEFFTAFYSNIPSHRHTLQYLFAGLDGYGNLVGFMWVSAIFSFIAIFMLLIPSLRDSEGKLAIACGLLFTSLWLDKGLGLVIGGFIPNPLEEITEYVPTGTELMIVLGVWATGAFILSALYKIAVDIKVQQSIE